MFYWSASHIFDQYEGPIIYCMFGAMWPSSVSGQLLSGEVLMSPFEVFLFCFFVVILITNGSMLNTKLILDR